MDEALLLLLLRLVGGVVLLGFLGTLAWFVYQDLRRTTDVVAASRQSQGHLRVVASESTGAAEGTLFPLLPVTRIGRAAGNTIVLEDAFVSAEHALLTRRERQWWLEDLHSRNGTVLNDLPLETATVVSAGDIIKIGGIHLKIEPVVNSA